MTKPVVLVSGTDPLDPGGHESYVRAHGIAAIRAGFEPHIFAMSSRSEVATYDFGIVHRVAGPIKSVTHTKAGLCQSAAASAIERFLQGHSPPHLIHAFSTWGGVGVDLKRRFARSGGSVIPITSAYSTKVHEMRKQLAGLRREHGLVKWLRYHLEYLWILAEVDRVERRGYAGSQMVLVNYDSVRRLLKESYALQVEIRRIPYASSVAFRDARQVPDRTPCKSIAALGPSRVPVIVAVSRQVPRKGIDVLLRALAQLDRARASFRACIVGPGTPARGSPPDGHRAGAFRESLDAWLGGGFLRILARGRYFCAAVAGRGERLRICARGSLGRQRRGGFGLRRNSGRSDRR